MSDFDPIRLAKLLEMAGHPSSNEGEALNSLRAARTLLARAGRSLGDLAASGRSAPAAIDEAPELRRLRRELRDLTEAHEKLTAENRRLRKENAQIEVLAAEIEFLKSNEQDDAVDHAPEAGVRRVSRGAVTADVVAIYDLLDEWRSIPDLVEKLGPGLGAPAVKRIVRLLHDKGLLRAVESWPTRYRLRFEGELSDTARTFRSRIEDARVLGQGDSP